MVVLKFKLVKNILLWTLIGAAFGVFFGGVASVFENGPTLLTGITQSWLWFAFAGALKAFTDPRPHSTTST